jgi:hypothetical protein
LKGQRPVVWGRRRREVVMKGLWRMRSGVVEGVRQRDGCGEGEVGQGRKQNDRRRGEAVVRLCQVVLTRRFLRMVSIEAESWSGVLEGRLRRMSSRSSGIEKTFSAGLVIVEERLEA